MKTVKLTLSLLLAMLFFGLAGNAIAQDSPPTPPANEPREITANDVNAVAKEVYCPVCESTPLDVCQTQACADWREVIRQKLENGESKQDIFNYFAEQYGDRVLATPPREGVNWLLWIMPFAAVLVGGFFFSRFMKNLRVDSDGDDMGGEKTAVSPSTAAPSDDDYIARVEKELNK